MTISKKLLLLTALALGIPFITQTYFAHPHNTLSYERERECILDFAQDLNQHRIVGWLYNKAMGTNEDKIITIANIINNPTLTTDSKLALFEEMIQKEKQAARSETISGIAQSICAGIMLTAFTGFMIWAIIEDIKNPRPVVYAAPRSGITVTWKTSWPEVTYNYNNPYMHNPYMYNPYIFPIKFNLF